MLIEFRVTNFRSFKDTQVFSMVADAGKEHLDTHTFEPEIPGFRRLISSAAIYGPNAAGKTNLLKALQFMQSVIINSASASPVGQLSYTPFKFEIATSEAPSEFQITFADPDSKIYYEYGFSMDAERVHHEWLTEYKIKGARVFERTYSKSKSDYVWVFGKALKGNRAIWRDSTRPNALFLSTAVQLNSTQLLPVFSWFQKRLVVMVGPTTFNLGLTLKVAGEPGGKDRLLPFIRIAEPHVADIKIDRQPLKAGAVFAGSVPIIEQTSPNDPPTVARITFAHEVPNSKELIGIDLSDESNGTQSLFHTAGAWLNVFRNGEVLLVDEIDTSLHPLLVQFLVERFHSEDSNPRHAQLVFTTHNTSLLTQTIFRRDQIWFIEKGPESNSRCYPLSDFSPRKDEIIERWYMRGRYGALPILTDVRL